MLNRQLASTVRRYLEDFPVSAIIGPRQVGKTTLAKKLVSEQSGVYLDLERPSDRERLDDVEAFLDAHEGDFICFDEIQWLPEIFPILRSVVDRTDTRFLMLGSAMPDLLRQSSESLAGRIVYHDLLPFAYAEYAGHRGLVEKWMRGGYPLSLLANSDESSFMWRKQFIRTFVERDLATHGIDFTEETMRRLWQMLAHLNGTLLNRSTLSRSLGIVVNTVGRYLDILEHTFMIRSLEPYHVNLSKRLVKTPKVYVRDSGLLHALLDVEDMSDLLGHPAYGNSFEGHVIEEICTRYPKWHPSFYRTVVGAEIDLILSKGLKRIAIEIKAGSTPNISRGFWSSLDDVKPDHAMIIGQVEQSYPKKEGVMVYPLVEALTVLDDWCG